MSVCLLGADLTSDGAAAPKQLEQLGGRQAGREKQLVEAQSSQLFKKKDGVNRPAVSIGVSRA